MRSRYSSSSSGEVMVPSASILACSAAPAKASSRLSTSFPNFVSGGVFARSAAKHCAEVIDEMGQVVPTQANGEVGVIDAGMALDLQRDLLQPVAAQHPLDRNADVAPEYSLLMVPIDRSRTPSCFRSAPRRREWALLVFPGGHANRLRNWRTGKSW